ncbi:MAG: glutamate 5-kinase [Actinomycetota bacterium]|nr:glutamate 5-kinase [Actinomycetota bacterium]
MRYPIEPGRPIVVKIGSSSLTTSGGVIDAEAIDRVTSQISWLRDAGHPAVLVSSGAVVAGLPSLGIIERPGDLPGLQAAAAVGQSKLIERYSQAFAEHDLVVGQVLLTRDVLAGREPHLHARAALDRLLSLGIVPIVNENDTVAVDELRFGDNDRLAAIVSHLVNAGLLIILTDTPGLYAHDPRLVAEPELLSAVRHTDDVLDGLDAGGSAGTFGSGGVATKVAAARMAAFSGIPTVVVGAIEPNAVRHAVAGEDVGTWVGPRSTGLGARRLWIAFSLPSLGVLTVDEGAVAALVDDGRSLLAAGVVGVKGDFLRGDAVEIHDEVGRLIGKGLAGLAGSTLRDVLGRHTSVAGGAAVHRDDLIVLV